MRSDAVLVEDSALQPEGGPRSLGLRTVLITRHGVLTGAPAAGGQLRRSAHLVAARTGAAACRADAGACGRRGKLALPS